MTLLKIKKLVEDAIIPHYVHEHDSGMDLFSVEETVLLPGERKLIGTGISIELEPGFEGQIRPKSGLAAKSGITVLNTPGTIDAGYRGEIKVILFNSSKEEFKVEKGKKIAQLIIAEVKQAKIKIVNELTNTSRGEGGFGSTGLEKHK